MAPNANRRLSIELRARIKLLKLADKFLAAATAALFGSSRGGLSQFAVKVNAKILRST